MRQATKTADTPAIDIDADVINLDPDFQAKDAEIVVHAPNQARRFRIAGDVVRKSIEKLPQDQQELVWWFYQFCHNRDFTREELGKILKRGNGDFYSADSILQLFHGTRIARKETIEPILKAIAPLRKIETERFALAKSGHLPNSLSIEIGKRCDLARLRQRIGFTIGDSQIGKTDALLEYQRTHNHGQTIYVEMPFGGSVGKLLKALARAFNIPEAQKSDTLAERIIECFTPSMLLIIDEAHRCFESRAGYIGLQTFSFIRELYNRAHCGMMISMTNQGLHNLLYGPHQKALEQIWRRRLPPLICPDVLPERDLALFAAAYQLSPASADHVEVKAKFRDTDGKIKSRVHRETTLGLQTRVNKKDGLGVWISTLQNASDIARAFKREITWGMVLTARCNDEAAELEFE